jgi:hypothetical protein
LRVDDGTQGAQTGPYQSSPGRSDGGLRRSPELAISRVIAIDAKTLRKHYRDELDTGQIKATAKVAESLFRRRAATAANPSPPPSSG